MTQPIERDAIYRRRRFPRDVIETCVRWYLTYRLSYRDLVSLMEEREVHVTHTTIMRWVFRYVPEYEKRWNRRAKPAGSSWRVDETYIHTRPKTGYLYRAVDKEGRRSTLCSRSGVESLQPWLSSGKQSCPAHLGGHGRSRSTAINRVIWACAGSVARSTAGNTSWCARAVT